MIRSYHALTTHVKCSQETSPVSIFFWILSRMAHMDALWLAICPPRADRITGVLGTSTPETQTGLMVVGRATQDSIPKVLHFLRYHFVEIEFE